MWNVKLGEYVIVVLTKVVNIDDSVPCQTLQDTALLV